MELDHDCLLEALSYCPSTGNFTWNYTKGSRAAKGSIAGSIEDDGYRVIRLNNKLYKAHRLAWFYCFKEWPLLDIDHINRNRSDNSLDNLREVTRTLNNTNTAARNSTGAKGVYANSCGKSYMAKVSRNYKSNYLGNFSSIEKADEAVKEFIRNENIIKL